MADIVLTLVVSPVIQEALSRVTSFVARWLHTATGFERELEKLKDLLEFIQSVIDDAEEKQQSNRAISLWLRDLKLVAEDAVDVLDECDYERLENEVKTRNRLNWTIHFSIGSSIGDKVKKINKRFDRLLSELQKRTGPLILATKCQCHSTTKQYPQTDSFLDSKVFGREDVVEEILRMLVNQKNEPISGVSIIGMAGLGKTTIARSLYKKAKEEKLYDLAAWVCVSEDFNEHTILSEMLEHFKDGASRRDNINVLLEDLAKELEKKTFLLILDDVWNKDPSKWDAFSSRLSKILKTTGNSVVVTTRSEQVASVMERTPMLNYGIQRLSDGGCWSIIEETVLRSSKQTSISSDLEVIGRDIAKQCGGLPLVAKVIGGTLSRQIYADKWLAIRKNNAWNLDSDDGNKILSILKISFDRLPSPLKKCFSYCSIFSKDFVIKKDDLVQLWMAQGFLYQPNESTKTMEDIGDEYFNDLLSNSLFQDIERDQFESIISCKMHDEVHDLALFVSKDETLIWETSCKIDQNANIRHLRVKYVGNELPVLPDVLLRRLHSLFTEDADVFNAMASNLKRLRSLKLAGARSHRHRNLAEAEKKELDPGLGELKHLRYFDISNQTGYALPKSFCKLYNLQTFRLIDYVYLPGGVMTDLVSLRHICFYTSTSYCVPRRIGHLASLQTLPVFSVGIKKGDGIVEELGGLTQLRGELKIMMLGNVRSRLEATQANLKEKAGLCKLQLDWACTNNSSNDEEVLEGLQPHPNLKSLSISLYKGKSFPPWMMSGGATFMSNNLVELELGHWPNCEHIPSLGLLPGLKFLYIHDFKNVKRMGHKFDTIGSNCPGGVKSIKLFPALRQLNLQSMESLEEWVEVDNDDDIVAGGKVEIVFPCLEILQIRNCPQLKIWRMGGFSSYHNKLSRLCISKCDNLMAIPSMNGLSSLQFLRIEKCFNPRSISEGCLRSLTSLKKLEMGYFCKELEEFPGLTHIHQLNSSLESLKLHGWDKVKSLPDQLQHLTALKKLTLYKFNGVGAFPEGLGNLTSLTQLNLVGFNGVEAFPEGLGNLTSLQQLSISYCRNLKHLFPLQALKSLIELTMGPFSADLEEFPGLDCIHHLHASLKELRLEGWDKIKFLPDQLQHLTALKFLNLRNFQSVEVLPDWLGNLSSLESLYISDCPILEERCVKNTGGVKYTGEEWSKISHIPHIIIDGDIIKRCEILYIKS